MSKYRTYIEYEQSGVDWIPKIPKGWKIGGLTKFLDSIVDYRGKTPEKVDDGVFLVTARNIKQGQINYNLSHEYIKVEHYEDVMRRGKPKIGDVLFTTEAPLGEVANVDREDIALAQRVIKFRALPEVLDNYYLKYWILSHPFQSNLKTFATGSTAEGIKASKLSSLQVLLPTLTEQRKIVGFLDKKTAGIDTLVESKYNLITLFEKQRQSIITEAVTKGLNPNVKMKDSGVEWIGEIPEHWEIRKVKEIANVHSSNIDKKSVEGEKEVLLCNYVDVYYNDSITADLDFMKATAKDDQIKTFTLKKHDVIITKDSESPTDIAIPTWVSQDLDGVVCGYHLSLIRCFENILGHFLYYALESVQIREQFYTRANGVTRFGLSKEAIKNGLIAIPPINEQIEIAEKLYVVNQEIRCTIEKVKMQIQKLTEYRQSLIYEAVTGKIDVRDLNLDEVR